MDAAQADTILKAEVLRLGHAWWGDTRDYDLFLFGLRAPTRKSDQFDDAIGCRFREGGVVRVEVWKATTDPGKPSLQAPMRAKGCAILPDGQHRRLWVLGNHKGKYPALTQNPATPVAVWRDNDRDDTLDLGSLSLQPPEVIGINCHRAGVDSPLVGSWSAGCQVHKRSATFDRMMQLARNQIDATSAVTFSYTLFDLVKSPALVELHRMAAA